MNTYHGSSMVKTGGCGCGGSTTAVAGGCSCGSGSCGSCQNQDYVRPNFFAGQLLTEEDLQSLNNYVVAKNRLHNRYLFGAGVVCGLDVSCNPCGGGTVTVNPGYALDCCGNDITVACATELDINNMIRELRRDMLGGYDCGDPCEDKKTGTGAADSGAAADLKDIKAQYLTADDPAKEAEIVRHYCLYVRYCEQMSDPVSPYATDEPCGYQTCEPTRVREGFRFELRCPPKGKKYDDLLTRICRCIGDRVSAKRSLKDAGALRYLESVQASQASRDINNIAAYTREINAAAKTAKEAIAAVRKEATEETVNNALEATRTLATYPARYLIADEATQKALAGNSGFGKALNEARNQLGQAAALSETIKSQRISDLERAFATTVIDSAAELAEVKEVSTEKAGASKKVKAGLPASANAATILLTETSPAPEVRARIEYIAAGKVWSGKVGGELISSLKAMKEELLEKLDSSPHLTDCTLRKEVSRIEIPEASQNSSAEEQNTLFARTEAISRQLHAAQLSYFRDCVCAALNPPCQPCDDMGVLLACLEVTDCEVRRICNLERTFVLSGPALRYWFSLDRRGDQLEQICCGDDETRPGVKGPTYDVSPNSQMFAKLLTLAMTACADEQKEDYEVVKVQDSTSIRYKMALAQQPALDQVNLMSAIAPPMVAGLASQIDALSTVNKQNAEILAEVKRLRTVADKTSALEERVRKLEGGK